MATAGVVHADVMPAVAWNGPAAEDPRRQGLRAVLQGRLAGLGRRLGDALIGQVLRQAQRHADPLQSGGTALATGRRRRLQRRPPAMGVGVTRRRDLRRRGLPARRPVGHAGHGYPSVLAALALSKPFSRFQPRNAAMPVARTATGSQPTWRACRPPLSWRGNGGPPSRTWWQSSSKDGRAAGERMWTSTRRSAADPSIRGAHGQDRKPPLSEGCRAWVVEPLGRERGVA